MTHAAAARALSQKEPPGCVGRASNAICCAEPEPAPADPLCGLCADPRPPADLAKRVRADFEILCPKGLKVSDEDHDLFELSDEEDEDGERARVVVWDESTQQARAAPRRWRPRTATPPAYRRQSSGGEPPSSQARAVAPTEALARRAARALPSAVEAAAERAVARRCALRVGSEARQPVQDLHRATAREKAADEDRAQAREEAQRARRRRARGTGYVGRCAACLSPGGGGGGGQARRPAQPPLRQPLGVPPQPQLERCTAAAATRGRVRVCACALAVGDEYDVEDEEELKARANVAHSVRL